MLKKGSQRIKQMLQYQPCFLINHIKNMEAEHLKHVLEEGQQSGSVVEHTDRVYKPSQTIEFNREGEVLLYSCDPIRHSVIYFKYPYILYESLIPASIWMYLYNPMDLHWSFNNLFGYLACTLWIPRVWYWRSLQYKVHRLSLLRGGKVLKVETNSLAGDRFRNWVETYQARPLMEDQKRFDCRDNADFLEKEGQLKYELGVQLDEFQEMGINQQDIVLYFMKQGIVHQPELFEAALKGYNIDTTDFVINTENNKRWNEGIHNL